MKEHSSNPWPSTGQFAAVWEYNHVVWANTYRWFGKNLRQIDDYGEAMDNCVSISSLESCASYGGKFYVAGK